MPSPRKILKNAILVLPNNPRIFQSHSTHVYHVSDVMGLMTL